MFSLSRMLPFALGVVGCLSIEEDSNVLLLQTKTQVQKSERTADQWDATDQSKYAGKEYEGKRPMQYYQYDAAKFTAGYDGSKPYTYSYTDMFGTPDDKKGGNDDKKGGSVSIMPVDYAKPMDYMPADYAKPMDYGTTSGGGTGASTAAAAVPNAPGTYDPCWYSAIKENNGILYAENNGMKCWQQPGQEPYHVYGTTPSPMPPGPKYTYDPCLYTPMIYDRNGLIYADNGMACWMQPGFYIPYHPPPGHDVHIDGFVSGDLHIEEHNSHPFPGPPGTYDPCMYSHGIHEGQFGIIYSDNGMPCWYQPHGYKPGYMPYDYGFPGYMPYDHAFPDYKPYDHGFPGDKPYDYKPYFGPGGYQYDHDGPMASKPYDYGFHGPYDYGTAYPGKYMDPYGNMIESPVEYTYGPYGMTNYGNYGPVGTAMTGMP